jgi:hypothetical protein
MFDGISGGKKLDPDIIDRFFEEYYTSRYHVSLLIGYSVPGKADISIPITQRDYLSWSTENKDGKLFIKIKTRLTDEEYGAAMESLRASGCKINMIKLGEYDYVDYGELSPECIIRFYIDTDLAWNIRSENINILNRDPTVSPESGHLLSLTAHKYPDKGNKEDYNIEQSGVVFIAIATGCELFSDKHLERAEQLDEIKDDLQITVRTDEDCMLPAPPDGYDLDEYDVLEDIIPDENTEAVTKYQNELRDVTRRRVLWAAIMSSTDPFIKNMLTTWIKTLNDEDGEIIIQVHLNDFMKWLRNNNSIELFMNTLHNSIKLNTDTFNIDFTKLKIEKEQIEYFKELMRIVRVYSKKIQDLAADTKIDLTKPIQSPEFAAKHADIPEIKLYEKLAMKLAIDVAIKNNLLETEPKDIPLEESPTIKYILLHLRDIFHSHTGG